MQIYYANKKFQQTNTSTNCNILRATKRFAFVNFAFLVFFIQLFAQSTTWPNKVISMMDHEMNSAGEIVCYIILACLLITISVFILYKLFKTFCSGPPDSDSKSRLSRDVRYSDLVPEIIFSSDESELSENGNVILPIDQQTKSNQLSRLIVGSQKNIAQVLKSKEIKEVNLKSYDISLLNQGSRNKYISNNNSMKGAQNNNDYVINQYLSNEKSLSSYKSVGTAIKSYGSKKSTGFEPSIKEEQNNQMNAGKKPNFLELLDKLDEIATQDAENANRKGGQKNRAALTASSSGIEANSSDETASQTFIGRGPDARPDPGQINLDIIGKQDPVSDLSH